MELTTHELDKIISCLANLVAKAFAEGDLDDAQQLSELVQKLRDYKEYVCKNKRDN